MNLLNSQSDTRIRVYCRCRPLNSLEKSQGGKICVQFDSKNIALKTQDLTGENKYDFTFDEIFGENSEQREIFDIVAKPIIEGIMEGFNGTIFAYGQTSSGKTFTMEGPDDVTEETKGIIPRMMDYVFELIINAPEDLEFTVSVSMIEIYNEKLHDLINTRKTNLHIKESKQKGIYIQDLTEISVNSVEQMKQLMLAGSENRTKAATKMNERSSRSHSLYILKIFQKNIKTENCKQGKLYFVDLAGSEKVSKTDVQGTQLKEAQNINKSLSCLGNVINALTSDKKEHIPYRDSKLTRILQESLGGNAKTSLIIACSMCSYNDKETLSTLRFGNRAKNIKNQPIKNEEKSVKELMILLEEADVKIKQKDLIIKQLEKELTGSKFADQYSFTQNNTIDQKNNITQKNHIIQNNFLGSDHKNEQSQKDLNSLEKMRKNSAMNLKVLKQHIKLTKVNEELRIKEEKIKSIQGEVISRNNEIESLNEKLLKQEEKNCRIIQKYYNYIQDLQFNFEKLFQENQEINQYSNKFKRDIQ